MIRRIGMSVLGVLLMSSWALGDDCTGVLTTSGSSQGNSSNAPWNGTYVHSRSMSIVKNSELPSGCNPPEITEIAMQIVTPSAMTFTDVKIWMKRTALIDFRSASPRTWDQSGTLVWDSANHGGVVDVSAARWKVFTFDQPFIWDSTDNLLICWQGQRATSASPVPTFQWNSAGSSTYTQCYASSDSAYPTALGPSPRGSIQRVQYQLTFAPVSIPVRCCMPDGTCQMQIPANCIAAAGTRSHYPSTCATEVVWYSASTATNPFEDISATGTHVTQAEVDEGGAAVTMPFPFMFYGLTDTNVGVSSNGYLLFGAPNPIYTYAHCYGIPTTFTSPQFFPLIGPLWQELNSGTGAVQYETRGTAPTRRFIVQWTYVENNASGHMDPPFYNTFQAVLYESTNAIEFRYEDVSIYPDQNGHGCAGVENSAGTVGTCVSSMVANGACIHLTPVYGPCTPVGACCHGATCTALTEFDCLRQSYDIHCAPQGFSWQPGGCDPWPCGSGACCLPNGTCFVTTQSDCEGQGGIYRGLDTTCEGASCVAACCVNYQCAGNLSHAACTSAGGIWHDLQDCATFICPPWNDNCSAVTPVTLVENVVQTFSGDNRGATDDTTSFCVMQYSWPSAIPKPPQV